MNKNSLLFYSFMHFFSATPFPTRTWGGRGGVAVGSLSSIVPADPVKVYINIL